MPVHTHRVRTGALDAQWLVFCFFFFFFVFFGFCVYMTPSAAHASADYEIYLPILLPGKRTPGTQRKRGLTLVTPTGLLRWCRWCLPPPAGREWVSVFCIFDKANCNCRSGGYRWRSQWTDIEKNTFGGWWKFTTHEDWPRRNGWRCTDTADFKAILDCQFKTQLVVIERGEVERLLHAEKMNWLISPD